MSSKQKQGTAPHGAPEQHAGESVTFTNVNKPVAEWFSNPDKRDIESVKYEGEHYHNNDRVAIQNGKAVQNAYQQAQTENP